MNLFRNKTFFLGSKNIYIKKIFNINVFILIGD